MPNDVTTTPCSHQIFSLEGPLIFYFRTEKFDASIQDINFLMTNGNIKSRTLGGGALTFEKFGFAAAFISFGFGLGHYYRFRNGVFPNARTVNHIFELTFTSISCSSHFNLKENMLSSFSDVGWIQKMGFFWNCVLKRRSSNHLLTYFAFKCVDSLLMTFHRE